ncbi:MAG TPA: DUF86 domain-containing protein, partial [Ktedonobacterales bacterium]|nr:DUF86 domain-containing protein [Ktedonobacterales bacterium]
CCAERANSRSGAAGAGRHSVSKRASALLEEIPASIRLIRQYTDSVPKDTFLASTQLQDAVLRRLELIGEGVKNLPEAWRESQPAVPWRQIARMRDTLIHRYFSVDLDIVWQTVTNDIPTLEPQIGAMLAHAREEEAANPDDAHDQP